MEEYIISCCSTADLSMEHFQERNISYICFHYELDGKEYPDDCGKTMDFEEFYRRMDNGAQTKTSQVNIEEFETYFEPFLKAGKDILHVSLSSGISGVMNSAMAAKAELEEKYPDRRIYVVDSLGASSGYGLLMDRLADLRDEGMDIDTLYHWTEEHKLEPASLVLLHRSEILYPGRQDFKNRRLCGRGAWDMPSAEYGRCRPPDPQDEDSFQAESDRGYRGQDGGVRTGRAGL